MDGRTDADLYASNAEQSPALTYAGTGFKVGAGINAAISIGKRISLNKLNHVPVYKGLIGTGIAGGVLGGVLTGMGGSLIKRKEKTAKVAEKELNMEEELYEVAQLTKQASELPMIIQDPVGPSRAYKTLSYLRRHKKGALGAAAATAAALGGAYAYSQKEASASDFNDKGEYTRGGAARTYGTGTAVLGALGGLPLGPAGVVAGGIGGGIGGGIAGALFGKGVKRGEPGSLGFHNWGKRIGTVGAVGGGLAGGLLGAEHGVKGAVGGLAAGALLGGASGYIQGGLNGAIGQTIRNPEEETYSDDVKTAALADIYPKTKAGLSAAGKWIKDNPRKATAAGVGTGMALGASYYAARPDEVDPEELDDAKTAAEIMFNDSLFAADVVNEKLAFAEDLYKEASYLENGFFKEASVGSVLGKTKAWIKANPRKAAAAGLIGSAAMAGGGYAATRRKDADEEIGEAKTAAEVIYNEALCEANEVNEKLAFADQLFKEASYVEKCAEDDGAGVSMSYVDQLRTPAGAAGVGAIAGGAAGALIGNFAKGFTPGVGAAVGAASMAGVGALTAFVNQHRQARAVQQLQQNGSPMQQ